YLIPPSCPTRRSSDLDRDGFATQMTRMAAGLGLLDLDNLDGSKIPWKGLDDWVYQGEDPPSVETCNTVGPNCIAPAGMLNPNGRSEEHTSELQSRENL